MSRGEANSRDDAGGRRGGVGVKFFVPVKTVSEANSHEHWRQRQKRAKEQRLAAAFGGASRCHPSELPPFPLVVTLTRVSPRELDDDNLQGATKHFRDGIADWLGVDDRKRDVVRYEYGQRKGAPVGVEVEIRPMEAAGVAK